MAERGDPTGDAQFVQSAGDPKRDELVARDREPAADLDLTDVPAGLDADSEQLAGRRDP